MARAGGWGWQVGRRAEEEGRPKGRLGRSGSGQLTVKARARARRMPWSVDVGFGREMGGERKGSDPTFMHARICSSLRRYLRYYPSRCDVPRCQARQAGWVGLDWTEDAQPAALGTRQQSAL